MQTALAFAPANGFELTLGGKSIPIADGYRPESIVIFYNDVFTRWESVIAWRYFLKPQRKGSYVYHMDLGPNSWERVLTYVPDEA